MDKVTGLLDQSIKQLFQTAIFGNLGKTFDHLGKLHQRTAFFRERLVLICMGEHLKQRDTQHCGNFLRLVHRCITNSAFWLIDNSL